MIAADAASASPDTITLVTSMVVAAAAVLTSLTPFVLGRVKSRREKKEKAAAEAVKAAETSASSITASNEGWNALNGALQREITRLTRLARDQQKQIDDLESKVSDQAEEILSLRTELLKLNGHG